MGRGILVDLYSWRQKQKDPALKEFNCFETSSIPLKDIKACLAAQGTEVKFGDILFTRTGKANPPPRRHPHAQEKKKKPRKKHCSTNKHAPQQAGTPSTPSCPRPS